jgi:hypothetical protein
MWTHPLARDVLIAVAVKVTLVVAAALFVFGPSQQPKIDASGVEAQLMGAPDFISKPKDISP